MGRAMWERIYDIKMKDIKVLRVGDYVLISRKWFKVSRVIEHGRARYVHVQMRNGYSLDLTTEMMRQLCIGIKRKLGA